MSERLVVPCAGAVVRDDNGRFLLVQRANEPGRGLWSIPGGRLEPGESTADAAAREVREETGLEVRVGRVLGTVERTYADDDGRQVILQIADHEATVVGGELSPGDDAADARWCTEDELRALPLVDLLVDALTEFGVLSR